MVGDVGLKVRLVMDETGWNLVLLRSLVVENVVEKILQAGLYLREREDKCV